MITVNGRTVGIARLCDAVSAVASMGLDRDDLVKAALLAEVEKNNFHPGKPCVMRTGLRWLEVYRTEQRQITRNRGR